METCLMWREKSTDVQTAAMSLSSQSQIFHVINASVMKAWLEYRSDAVARELTPGKQLDLLEFTLHITEALAGADSRPKVQKRGRPALSPLVTSQKARYAENRPVQDVGFDQVGHWPLRTDSRAQRCKLEGCTGQTRIMCEKCNVHLCLAKAQNCFRGFHMNNS
ncbi:hypothetical protein HPB49_006195 [Dermacentor silvarum]|uniref:Uncharacterized protein n=1 Tax=Dermacentor silvarum TaxID=543639 RepID=A0ACB8CDK2_DERSI|nr:hypothetical protein HPB49_006195 [Dermacentor silvarum]